MFIEKISKTKKEEYIQNYIDEKNLELCPFTPLDKMDGEDKAYKKLEPDEQDKQYAKEYGYDKLFENLEKENIYIRFYHTADEDFIHRYSYQHAFIFVFGDNNVKIFEKHIGTRAYYCECCDSIKKYLKENLEKIKIDDRLEVNTEYVTTFMAENVKDIENYIDHIDGIYKTKKNNFVSKLDREKSKVLSKVMAVVFEK